MKKVEKKLGKVTIITHNYVGIICECRESRGKAFSSLSVVFQV